MVDIKGGTASLCYEIGVLTINLIVAAYDVYKSGSSTSTGGYFTSSGGGVSYGLSADSIKITTPDGTIHTYYGVDIESLRIY